MMHGVLCAPAKHVDDQHLLALQASQQVDEQRDVIALQAGGTGGEQLPNQVHDARVCSAVAALELRHETGQHREQRLGADEVHAGEQGGFVGRGQSVVGWQFGEKAGERNVHHVLVGFEHVGHKPVCIRCCMHDGGNVENAYL